MASCGGGTNDSNADAAPAAARSQRTQAFFPSVEIPADAHREGMWSPVYQWPLFPVHAALLPDGRVVTYATETDTYDYWDGSGSPEKGHATLPNGTGTNLFCSALQVLPGSGDLFVAGGDTTPSTNSGNNRSTVISSRKGGGIARGNDMNRIRWYASAITLTNGETLIQGGTGGEDHPEVRSIDGKFRLLPGADTSGVGWDYPRNFVTPGGRVFGIGTNGAMYYLDPEGQGALESAGDIWSYNVLTGGASAAMYSPGKILVFGGSSSTALTVDVSEDSTPVVKQTNSMSSRRAFVNAAILPDGRVLATGGNRDGLWIGGVGISDYNANRSAEIWDPKTGAWTLGAAQQRARLYHSGSILLPDASVMVFGSQDPVYDDVEIYYPPYLFDAGGKRAERPTIVDAPNELEIGKTFELEVGAGEAIGRVTLVRTAAVTHSFNMGQRFLELTFRKSGSKLTVQAPTRAGEAPPGYYHVFVLDANGVPSVSKIVSLGIAAKANPSIVPKLSDPGNQNTTVGDKVTLKLKASDPNGDKLRFSASGLPTGLKLNETSGTISGTAGKAGSYDVVVTASDGINSDSERFAWSVAATNALVLTDAPEPDADVIAGGTARFEAAARGDGARYRWNFGDGSAATGWSRSGAAEHVYEKAGIYTVTLTVTDNDGTVLTRSFEQTVAPKPPVTKARAAASSNLLADADRVWVVNQDNDSVSVFDAKSRKRLAEIEVGAAPRAIARALDGRLWVTNKRDATISVIDPQQLAVVRTVELPRGSQPHGIVAASRSATAYVTLEAAGRLLKFDTAKVRKTAERDVGAYPRHLSISADGGTLYVSRFVTPPLPGEGTLKVATPSSAGGRLLVVDTAKLAIERTLVLRHSDRPDEEKSGAGVPNYLGALAISPDGQQGWLPSKLDNVKRGQLRNGKPLNFQNTVRAVSSRLTLGSKPSEQLERRVDHDNASVASAALYDRKGSYVFVALETSREVAVLNAQSGAELLRVTVGRAPDGLALAADGRTLYVNNFMDRSVSVLDLRKLLAKGQAQVPVAALLDAVATERLDAQVLAGKQLFYDARDPRLARDRYLSCASCHNDGSHDGRVWDLGSLGEGLRNTVNLRGRGGGQGNLHWSGNFDEVQDFEIQIRDLAGGTGLMSDADLDSGDRRSPLGTPKAGVSEPLDALAAYVASLNKFDPSPQRPGARALSTTAEAGRKLFRKLDCASCHAGQAFSNSTSTIIADIGTVKKGSGKRLGDTLWGIDVPTLRDVSTTGPYLHDGSAATLQAAIRAHLGVGAGLDAKSLDRLAAYLLETGGDESVAPQAEGKGAGLTREADGTTTRWSGWLEAPATGNYLFQLDVAFAAVRLRLEGQQVIDSATNNVSGLRYMAAGERQAITIEADSVTHAPPVLSWRSPGNSRYAVIPKDRLYAK